MLQHVCVVSLAFVLTLNRGGLFVQQALADDHGWNNRELLETFEYEAAGLQQDSFRLDWDINDIDVSDFERYVFELDADSFPGLGGGGTSVFFVQVTTLEGDVICRGVLGDFFGVNAPSIVTTCGHVISITSRSSAPSRPT